MANTIAGWTLIALGVVGFLGALLGVQQLIGLPNLNFSLGWPDFELRLNFLALAILLIGCGVIGRKSVARKAAMVISWIMLVFTAAGPVYLMIFGSGEPPQIWLVQGPLDVIWTLAFLWIALTLERSDVAALYSATADRAS